MDRSQPSSLENAQEPWYDPGSLAYRPTSPAYWTLEPEKKKPDVENLSSDEEEEEEVIAGPSSDEEEVGDKRPLHKARKAGRKLVRRVRRINKRRILDGDSSSSDEGDVTDKLSTYLKNQIKTSEEKFKSTKTNILKLKQDKQQEVKAAKTELERRQDLLTKVKTKMRTFEERKREQEAKFEHQINRQKERMDSLQKVMERTQKKYEDMLLNLESEREELLKNLEADTEAYESQDAKVRELLQPVEQEQDELDRLQKELNELWKLLEEHQKEKTYARQQVCCSSSSSSVVQPLCSSSSSSCSAPTQDPIYWDKEKVKSFFTENGFTERCPICCNMPVGPTCDDCKSHKSKMSYSCAECHATYQNQNLNSAKHQIHPHLEGGDTGCQDVIGQGSVFAFFEKIEEQNQFLMTLERAIQSPYFTPLKFNGFEEFCTSEKVRKWIQASRDFQTKMKAFKKQQQSDGTFTSSSKTSKSSSDLSTLERFNSFNPKEMGDSILAAAGSVICKMCGTPTSMPCQHPSTITGDTLPEHVQKLKEDDDRKLAIHLRDNCMVTHCGGRMTDGKACPTYYCQLCLFVCDKDPDDQERSCYTHLETCAYHEKRYPYKSVKEMNAFVRTRAQLVAHRGLGYIQSQAKKNAVIRYLRQHAPLWYGFPKSKFVNKFPAYFNCMNMDCANVGLVIDASEQKFCTLCRKDYNQLYTTVSLSSFI